ncbi:TadE family type IV pilus minor pilin [Modestobacter sp. Leaf380]|uniref:TadE family type IV pilus minor pilin n=1 Tax=Modestobacter sp. Leaf380 TaxID=1736356 RepID=UPI0007013E8E|nr:TadE family type IV pilus minor pilin [Modestobacter sp. Leaf380]KQS68619.1 pilus assembly protein TadE [Modestobacter sp. Leaf380]
MVTAETAVVLPVLLLVLAGAVAAVVVVGAQLRCVDAAREGARAAARGESSALVTSLAGRAGPDGAVVTSTVTGDQVTVTVSARVQPLGPLPVAVTVSATATGLVEPGAGGAPP